MQHRKAKLFTLTGLKDRALSTKRYQERMQEALSEPDYRSVVASINGMQSMVSGQRQTVVRYIYSIETRIRGLQRQFDELRYNNVEIYSHICHRLPIATPVISYYEFFLPLLLPL